MKKTSVGIFGLGYVGTVSAACLAQAGHTVFGVDTNPTKVDFINQGRSPILEPELGTLLSEAVESGRLRASTEAAEAVHESDISIICVGTPSNANGSLDLRYVIRVAEEIGRALVDKAGEHLVALRSTVLPGSTRQKIIPKLEKASGKRAGDGIGICMNPEFLREGSAVADFYHPARTIIGELIPGHGDPLALLYQELEAPIVRTDIETAELVKYVDNCWHALKIAFANEIGNLAKELEIDSHKVMEIFSMDTKLNLSAAYLKPGFAFGGSCLPKDLRALTYMAKRLDLELPILNAISISNRRQIEKGVRLVIDQGNKKVGVVGLSFKAGTDDLRESPMVELVERLIGKGYDIRIYDRSVRMASLTGANREYILTHIPHLSNLLVENMDQLINHADTLVIGHSDEECRNALESLRKEQVVIDFARIYEDTDRVKAYEGISW